MKIAIISDTHDNIPNIEKFLEWAQKNKIEIIIHCGDVATGETIRFLAENFKGPIHLVYGNMDWPYRVETNEACNQLENVKLHDNIGNLIIENLSIAFCHLPEVAKKLAESGKYHLVFYGHTHKPWIETLENKCQLINPGALGGLFQKATFAAYDTENGKLELKILETL